MKIALCFFGYFGKQNILHKLNQLNGYSLNDYNEMWSIEHFKKNIIQNYDVDIFFHCWNQDSESQKLLLNEYQPKDYLFETQNKNYDKKNHIFKRHISESKSINLMNKYAEKNNIKYDFVFLSIFDQIFFTKINFNELNTDFIYNSHFNSYNQKDNFHHINKNALYDQWYIANMKNIKKITNFFSIINIHKKFYYKKYGTHIHRYELIKEENLLNKLKFILYASFDHVKVNQIFFNQYKHNLERLK